MHAPILENAATPSREASEPDYLDALFGPACGDAPAPGIIYDLVSEVVELSQAAPQTVTAAALAVIAAAMGPKVALRQGRNVIPVSFSVVVSHRAPRTLPWFDAVTAAFTGRVFEMQAALLKAGKTQIKEDIARREKDFQRAKQTIQPNPELLARLQAESEQAQARLRPMVATSGVVPKELGRVLPQAFDGGVAIVAAGNDPGADLLRLKAPERAHLAELLNRSWAGTPLSFGPGVYNGNVSLLWQTRIGIKDLLGARGFDPGFVSVPALMFRDDSEAKPVPEFVCEAGWRRLLNSFFDHRCVGRESVFDLNPEAKAVLAGFAEHVAANLAAVLPALRPHIAWLPELASRLVTLYWIMGEHNDTAIDAATASNAVEMTGWLGRQHLVAIGDIGLPDAAACTDRVAQMLAKIRVKQPITRRELWGSFDHPKAAWFEPALASLISADKVAYDEGERLVACNPVVTGV